MLRAGDITDLVLDLGIQSPRIAGKEGGHGERVYVLSFGPPAYRQTMIIESDWAMDDVRAKLEAARPSPLVEAPVPAPEAKSPPAATPAPAKGKRKARESV